jgi:hypothetical protein
MSQGQVPLARLEAGLNIISVGIVLIGCRATGLYQIRKVRQFGTLRGLVGRTCTKTNVL